MNETLEFDIIVNGKKAKSSIKEVENAQDDLESKTKTSTNNMKTNWAALGTKIAAVGVVMGTAAKASLELERATFGMTQSTKDYIKQASSQLGINQQLIANFVRMGKSAGMSGDQIKQMVEDSVAIQRMYPHEAVDTIVDGYKEMARTGEAAGFMMDVLTDRFSETEVRAMTLEEKLRAVAEITKGVNEEFANTNVSKWDKLVAETEGTLSELGDSLIDLGKNSGAFWVFNKAVSTASVMLQGFSRIARGFKITIDDIRGEDVTEAWKKFNEDGKKLSNDTNELLGKLPEGAEVGVSAPKIEGRKTSTTNTNDTKVVKKELKMSESSWQSYYEKIGDLENAWISKSSQLKAQYKDLNEEQMQELLQISKDEYFSKFGTLMEQQLQDTKTIGDEITSIFDDTFSKNFADSLLSGKASFTDFANSIINDIARMVIQQNVTSPITSFLGKAIGNLFTPSTSYTDGGKFSYATSGPYAGMAKGGVSGTRLAQGGVISSPTKMRFAQGGTGLVGERNRPEGVLPLTRTASGDLGVMTSGGSGSTTQNMAEVYITINAIDTQTGTSFLLANKDSIEGIINNSLSTNGTVRANL